MLLKEMVKKIFFNIIFKTENRFKKLRHDYLVQNLQSNFLAIGSGCRFNGTFFIKGFKNIKIGENVHFGDNIYIRGEGGLEIGSNTHISRNVTIYTINHNYEGKCLPYDDSYIKKKVIIGDNVWIGRNVTIVPGTSIGEGAIIGMGTSVFGEIEPLSIVGPNGYKVLKYRDKDRYEKLKSEGLFGGVNGKMIVTPLRK